MCSCQSGLNLAQSKAQESVRARLRLGPRLFVRHRPHLEIAVSSIEIGVNRNCHPAAPVIRRRFRDHRGSKFVYAESAKSATILVAGVSSDDDFLAVFVTAFVAAAWVPLRKLEPGPGREQRVP